MSGSGENQVSTSTLSDSEYSDLDECSQEPEQNAHPLAREASLVINDEEFSSSVTFCIDKKLDSKLQDALSDAFPQSNFTGDTQCEEFSKVFKNLKDILVSRMNQNLSNSSLKLEKVPNLSPTETPKEIVLIIGSSSYLANVLKKLVHVLSDTIVDVNPILKIHFVPSSWPDLDQDPFLYHIIPPDMISKSKGSKFWPGFLADPAAENSDSNFTN